MRIGVVGDIHGSYPSLKRALSQMGSIDRLLFTGDGTREIIRLTEETGLTVHGVRGNCDFVAAFPDEEWLDLDGVSVFLSHGHQYGVKSGLTRISLAGQEKGAQLIIFGHTHLPLVSEWNGIILFNPGTLSPERAYQGMSYGVIELNKKGINSQINKVNFRS